MKIIKTVSLFLILSCFFICKATEKNIHIFPLFSTKDNLETSNSYSEILKSKLYLTGIFDIVYYLKNMKPVFYGDGVNNQSAVKEKVAEICSQKRNIANAVFGFLFKSEKRYKIEIMIYSTITKTILLEYKDIFQSENDMEKSAGNCAVEIAVKIRDFKNSKILKSSVLIPGAGNFITGKKMKGVFLLGGFSYLMYKAISVKSKKLKYDNGIFYINGSPAYWGDWLEARDRNIDLRKKRKNYFTAAGAVYLLNILDAYLTSKKYDYNNVIASRLENNKIVSDDGKYSVKNSEFESSRKNISLFPVFIDSTGIDVADKYNSVLKEKLIRTGVFNVEELTLKEISYSNEQEVLDRITRKCRETGYESAVYGFLLKKNFGYEVRIYLYSVTDDGVISMYTDRLYSIEEVEMSVKNCAVEFASRVLSIKSSRMFFASFFMPGLGQFINKDYLKGSVFLGGFIYCFFKNKKMNISEFREVTFKESHFYGKKKYYIDRLEVSYENWIMLKNEYDKRKKNHNELKLEKRTYQIGMGVFYLGSIIDILISMKKYNNKRQLEKRISLDIIPYGSVPEIRLSVNF